MNNRMIIAVKDFSSYPAGREELDGPYNGSKFRESILLPELLESIRKNGRLVVSFNGVKSFSTSFLEEAFGGLMRSSAFKDSKFSKLDLEKHLRIANDWPGSEKYRMFIGKYLELEVLSE